VSQSQYKEVYENNANVVVSGQPVSSPPPPHPLNYIFRVQRTEKTGTCTYLQLIASLNRLLQCTHHNDDIFLPYCPLDRLNMRGTMGPLDDSLSYCDKTSPNGQQRELFRGGDFESRDAANRGRGAGWPSAACLKKSEGMEVRWFSPRKSVPSVDLKGRL
jgi:hypothetical protein